MSHPLLMAANQRRRQIMTTQSKGTALITGASSGMGAVYADRLARRGYDLIIVARNRGKLDQLATRLTYAAVPGFVARGTGTIINISSSVAISPETLNGVYGGSKAYVLAFSHSLQHELAPKGIRIQAVLPGATATDFWDAGGLPVHNLPSAIVMTAENLVDAALSGLDQGELVTIPALPDKEEWDRFEAARRDMSTRLSQTNPAARYGVKALAEASK